jgi:hypothetical protein
VTPLSLPAVDAQDAVFASAFAAGDVSPVRPL